MRPVVRDSILGSVRDPDLSPSEQTSISHALSIRLSSVVAHFLNSLEKMYRTVQSQISKKFTVLHGTHMPANYQRQRASTPVEGHLPIVAAAPSVFEVRVETLLASRVEYTVPPDRRPGPMGERYNYGIWTSTLTGLLGA